MTSSELAVKCRQLVKTYDTGDQKIAALQGIDLDIHMGELMMLVGPSGCGKTTLISVIAGILDQDSGQCDVFGVDWLHLSSKNKLLFRAQNIGFVFQAYNLLPTLTAAENVAVPLIINGMKRQLAVRKAAELLEKVGLAERAESLPSQLSGGQQQRVAIARSLVHNPRLIVCDEPTSALDHQTGIHVIELLKSVAVASDRALIIVTHDARIFDYADRIARMDDGRIENVNAMARHSEFTKEDDNVT
ncbi:MAG: ABC transporter ATP-binding protein [Methylococcaceae bacterium]|nr:ABC transporter ATP-binding protein [Methylococcaceae bacterium]MDZ4154917.1 ABC transporter ATP-binding protein [Methylococcales bacterium]MDP2392456.1 ABC transporter ATP-binding protein [Methylococcaceae bacterium]MDP3019562.1 ABC transporter ATP-binding protein [Methylococcaceae bacterium]MDP3388340.1 ABC transporter ATP-binding protein [Methylococcaceae bacterium]